MKKIVPVCALLFVYSVQMVAYQKTGYIWLAPMLLLVTVTILPTINEKKPDSILITLPLVVSIPGLFAGLLLNFWVGNYRMNNFIYCSLAAILSYFGGIILVILWRKAIVYYFQRGFS